MYRSSFSLHAVVLIRAVSYSPVDPYLTPSHPSARNHYGVLACGRFTFDPSAMENTKHHRYKEQRRHGGKKQSTDHGAAQGGILFATFTPSKSHRQHSDNHRQRSHDDRP